MIKLYQATLILLFFHFAVWSHAHIFVDYKLHAIATSEGLQGIYVNWTFDRMFASFIKEEFDKDKDNKLSKEEQKHVYEKSFRDWKRGDYFGVLKLNDKKVVFPTAQKFSARLTKEGDVVEYTFYIPLNIKANEREMHCTLHFIDPVIYIDFSATDKDLTLKNKSPETITVTKSLKKVGYTKQATFSFVKK